MPITQRMRIFGTFGSFYYFSNVYFGFTLRCNFSFNLMGRFGLIGDVNISLLCITLNVILYLCYCNITFSFVSYFLSAPYYKTYFILAQVTIIVVAVPEGLPLAVTLTYASFSVKYFLLFR